MPKFSFLTKNLVQLGPQKCQKPQGRPEAMPNFSFLTKNLVQFGLLSLLTIPGTEN